MKHIVLSGVNLTDGGPLTIYKQVLSEIVKEGYDKENKITAFVHNKDEFKKYENSIELIELLDAKKSYLRRMYYEYFYFKKYSKKQDIDVWISLHDMTPNVIAKEQFVYCHNPSPFNKAKLSKGIKSYIYTKFYKYIYKINIRKNTGVIVQQEWIRKEFKKMYKIDNVIVARPNQEIQQYEITDKSKNNEKFKFIFAAFPRNFKNFEVICQASKMLMEKGINDFEVELTIDGTENNYSKRIVEKYKNVKPIKFIGLLKQKNLFKKYNESNCMIFPSKLETWGLPISEYKQTNKPIILADLSYAHETIGKYDKVIFFNPNNEEELSKIMINEIEGKNIYTKTEETKEKEPYAHNWEELLKIIIK